MAKSWGRRRWRLRSCRRHCEFWRRPSNGQMILRKDRPTRGRRWRNAPRSVLLFFDFQIQSDVLAAVKVGDGPGGRLRAFFLRVDFIIGIQIETAKAVFARIVRVGAAYHIGTGVLE